MAKVLEKTNVIIMGSEFPEIVSACKMIPAANIQVALKLAEKETGKSPQVLVVPQHCSSCQSSVQIIPSIFQNNNIA
jgi:hypothetical protein